MDPSPTLRSTRRPRSIGRKGVLYLVCSLAMTVPLAQAADACTLYSTASQTVQLQCRERLSQCSYVQRREGSSSLNQTEAELGIVFGRINDAVQMGNVSETCFSSFTTFYCLQVYSICLESSGGNYAPTEDSVCLSDCENAMNVVCANEWSYLAEAVRELRQDGLVGLAVLKENCSDAGTGQTCLFLQPDPLDNCPAETKAIPLELIIGLSVGVGTPLIATIFFVAICCCCLRIDRTKSREAAEEAAARRSGPGSRKVASPIEGQGTPETRRRLGTLLLHRSMNKGALMGVEMNPRSGTLVRQIGSREFTKMSSKQRFQTLEFPHSNICILKDLCETNFGKVYLGEATGLRESELSTSIYVKSLRERAGSKLRQQFTAEMAWTSGFTHPNILVLLAISTKEEPLYMVYEFLEYGALSDFLQSIDLAWMDFEKVLDEEDAVSTHASSEHPMLAIEDLVSMGVQVAEGMEYLAFKGIVHKDLAARNCHVGQGLTVKIANFGLSYNTQSKDYCQFSSAKRSPPRPLRWLAPESLQHGRFSTYSDVWSFGVLLWEIFSFGAQPYGEDSNAQVVKNIVNMSLLPSPAKCPDEVYTIMLACWQRMPNKRPLFSTLGKELRVVHGEEGQEKLGVRSSKRFNRVPSNPKLV